MWGRYIKYTPDTKWWQVWNTIDTLKKRVTEVSTQFWNPGKPKAPIPWLETSHVPWEWFSTLDYESPFTLHYKWPRFNSWVGKSPRGGHSNPLQYSWLENPMDRSAWWAMVHRVAKSWTWLKPLSVHIHTCCSCWRLSAWSLCCTPREATATRSQHTTKSSPCSPGLEKACAKQQRPVQHQRSQHQSVVSGAPGIHQHHLEFIRCQTLDPILDLRSQKLWVGANNLWPNKPSRWFWCTTNWENHRGKGWAENEEKSARKEKWEFLEEVVNGDKCCGLKQSSHYIWWNRMFLMTLPGIVFHGWADWGLIWNNNNKMESKRKRRDR